MESIKMRNNLFHPDNVKEFEVNRHTDNGIRQKNFINGLQNARNILRSLERSIKKTNQYEQRLLQCKSRHPHSHCNSLENKQYDTKTGNVKSSRSQVDLAESWSTMSIVCLQYQYEELSSRYEALLRAYDESCSALNTRDDALSKLRGEAADAHARLLRTNHAMLGIGDLYLKLREKSLAQKMTFKAKISSLRENISQCLLLAEKARVELDAELAHKMAHETDSLRAMLLAEIRKCNSLYLENMLLKKTNEDVCK